MNDKEFLYNAGLARARAFCAHNGIPMPAVRRLAPTDRLYHLATCAYYRRNEGIVIMVEKCAHCGHGGRAWSWPAYAVDRTPFGVVQHELGHHVDEHFSRVENGVVKRHFAKEIYERSREEPLTGYLGNYANPNALHFFMEWFAENFRLFVTNPDLSRRLRPRFFAALVAAGVKPLEGGDVATWDRQLGVFLAPARILDQARKKIEAAAAATPELFTP